MVFSYSKCQNNYKKTVVWARHHTVHVSGSEMCSSRGNYLFFFYAVLMAAKRRRRREETVFHWLHIDSNWGTDKCEAAMAQALCSCADNDSDDISWTAMSSYTTLSSGYGRLLVRGEGDLPEWLSLYCCSRRDTFRKTSPVMEPSELPSTWAPEHFASFTSLIY